MHGSLARTTSGWGSLCVGLVLVCAAAILGAAEARASTTLETVAYEGFDYSATLANGSSISASSGGSGWTGAWTAGCSMTFNSTGLTYSGLTAVGGRAEFGNGCSLNNDLSRSLTRYDSGVVYVQFLSQLNLRGGGTPQMRLVDSGTTTGIVGNNDGGAEMALLSPPAFSKVDPGAPTSSGVSITNLNLTIVRIDHDNDRTQMWVNPNLATFDYLNPTGPQVTVNSYSPAFDSITLLVRNDTTDYFDEISIKRLVRTPEDPVQRPPDWVQQVGRLEGEMCPADWSASWAQWPHGGTGGFVCVQVLTWSHAQQAFVLARSRGMTGSAP